MANFFTLEDTAYLYSQIMTLWLRYQKLLPLNVHTVRYEALTGNTEAVLRPLLKFLDVPWDDAVLDHRRYTQTTERVNTASYRQVSEPIYTHAQYRWRRYEKYFESVMPTLQPWIDTFEYAVPKHVDGG